MAGVRVAAHELIEVAGQAILLSRRFDREGERRIPFLSALSMMGLKDGERGVIQSWSMFWCRPAPRQSVTPPSSIAGWC